METQPFEAPAPEASVDEPPPNEPLDPSGRAADFYGPDAVFKGNEGNWGQEPAEAKRGERSTLTGPLGAQLEGLRGFLNDVPVVGGFISDDRGSLFGPSAHTAEQQALLDAEPSLRTGLARTAATYDEVVARNLNYALEEVQNTFKYLQRADDDVRALFGQGIKKDPETGFDLTPSGPSIIPQLVGDTIGNVLSAPIRAGFMPVSYWLLEGLGQPTTGFLTGLNMMIVGSQDALRNGASVQDKLLIDVGWQLMGDPFRSYELMDRAKNELAVNMGVEQANANILGALALPIGAGAVAREHLLGGPTAEETLKHFWGLLAGHDPNDPTRDRNVTNLPVTGGILNLLTSGEPLNPMNYVGWGFGGSALRTTERVTELPALAQAIGRVTKNLPLFKNIPELTNAERLAFGASGAPMVGRNIDNALALFAVVDQAVSKGLSLPVELAVKGIGRLGHATPVAKLIIEGNRATKFLEELGHVQGVVDEAYRVGYTVDDFARVAEGKSIGEMMPRLPETSREPLSRAITAARQAIAEKPDPTSAIVGKDQVAFMHAIAEPLAKKYGIRPERNSIEQVYDFTRASIKEGFLIMSPSYHINNWLDNTFVKGLLHGYAPMGTDALNAIRAAEGLPLNPLAEGFTTMMTSGVTGGEIAAKYLPKHGGGIFTSFPIIGPAFRKVAEKGRYMEEMAHNGAWAHGYLQNKRELKQLFIDHGLEQMFRTRFADFDTPGSLGNEMWKWTRGLMEKFDGSGDELGSVLMGLRSSDGGRFAVRPEIYGPFSNEYDSLFAGWAKLQETMGDGYARSPEAKQVFTEFKDSVMKTLKNRSEIKLINNPDSQASMSEMEAKGWAMLTAKMKDINSAEQAMDYFLLMLKATELKGNVHSAAQQMNINAMKGASGTMSTPRGNWGWSDNDKVALKWTEGHETIMDLQGAMGAAMDMVSLGKYRPLADAAELGKVQGLAREWAVIVKDATHKTADEVDKFLSHPQPVIDDVTGLPKMTRGTLTYVNGTLEVVGAKPIMMTGAEKQARVQEMWAAHNARMTTELTAMADKVEALAKGAYGPNLDGFYAGLYPNRLPTATPVDRFEALGFWERYLGHQASGTQAHRAQNRGNLSVLGQNAIDSAEAIFRDMGRKAETLALTGQPRAREGFGMLDDRQLQQGIADDVVRGYVDLQTKASKAATLFEERLLFNYGYQTNFDTFLQHFSPFTIWQTRNIPLYAQILASKPNLLRLLNEVDEQSDIDTQEGYASPRMRGTTRLSPLDSVMSAITGTNVNAFGKPFSNLISIMGQIDRAPYVPQGAHPAAGAVAGAQYVTGGTSPWPYLDIPLKLGGFYGPPQSWSFGSLFAPSRAIYGATGVDIEKFWKDWAYDFMGVKTISGSPIMDAHVRQRIAEIGSREEIDEELIFAAMRDPKSELWKRAYKETERIERATTLVNYSFPLGLKLMTPEEVALNKARQEKGFKGALQVPGYPAFIQKNASDQKLEILQGSAGYYGLSTDQQQELSSTYNRLGTTAKREWQTANPAEYKELQKFWGAQTAWRADPENAATLLYMQWRNREYDAGNKPTLNGWLASIPLPTKAAERAPSADTLASYRTVADAATRAQRAEADLRTVISERTAILEPVFAKQNAYYALPVGDQRSAYLAQNPDLKAAWRARDAYDDRQPISGQYYQWKAQQKKEGAGDDDTQVADYLAALRASKVPSFTPRDLIPSGRLEMMRDDYGSIGENNPDVMARLKANQTGAAYNAYVRSSPVAQQIVAEQKKFKEENPAYAAFTTWQGKEYDANRGATATLENYVKSLGANAESKIPAYKGGQTSSTTTASSTATPTATGSGSSTSRPSAQTGSTGNARTANSGTTLAPASATRSGSGTSGQTSALTSSSSAKPAGSEPYGQFRPTRGPDIGPALTGAREQYNALGVDPTYQAYRAISDPDQRTAYLNQNRTVLQPVLDAQESFKVQNPEYWRYLLWAGDRLDAGQRADTNTYVAAYLGGNLPSHLSDEGMRLRADLTTDRRQIKTGLTPEQAELYAKYNGIENDDLRKRYAAAYAAELKPIFDANAAYKTANPEYWRYTLWSADKLRADDEAGIDNYVRDRTAGRLPNYLSDEAMNARTALEAEAGEYRAIADKNRELYDAYLARPAAQDRTAFLRGHQSVGKTLDAQRAYREGHPIYARYSAWAGDQYDEGKEAGIDNFIRSVYASKARGATGQAVTDIGAGGNILPMRGPESVRSGMNR